jgi:hypothetical protein
MPVSNDLAGVPNWHCYRPNRSSDVPRVFPTMILVVLLIGSNPADQKPYSIEAMVLWLYSQMHVDLANIL